MGALLLWGAGAMAQTPPSPAQACPADAWTCSFTDPLPTGCDPDAFQAIRNVCSQLQATTQTEGQLRSDLASAKARVSTLEGQVTDLQQQLNNAQKNLSNTEKELISAQSTITEKTGALRSLESTLGELTKKEERLRAERDSLKHALDTVSQELETANDEHQEALEAFNSASQEQKAQAKRHLDATAARLKQMTQERDSAQMQVAQKNALLESTTEQVNQTNEEKKNTEQALADARRQAAEKAKEYTDLLALVATAKKIIAVVAIFFGTILFFLFVFGYSKSKQLMRESLKKYKDDLHPQATVIEREAVTELARLQTLSAVVRLLLYPSAIASMTGILVAVCVIAIQAALATDATVIMKELREGGIRQFLLGLATPTGVLLTIFGVLHSNVTTTFKLCGDLKIFERKTEQPPPATAEQAVPPPPEAVKSAA
jgi:predicted  nucleic acid-binding Zn-ribbon protein